MRFSLVQTSTSCTPDERRKIGTRRPIDLLRLLHGNEALTLADASDLARFPAYFTCKRAVRELRDEVRGRRSEGHDRSVFHDEFLRAGYVPPHLLAAELLQR